jgi:hypothetical protein
MICVRLDGGLGNQLFQYAAGRALALQHATGLLLDTSTLQRRARSVTPRNLELQHFQHAGHLSTPSASSLLRWAHRAARVSHWVSPWRTFVEKGVGYQGGFSALPNQTYLVGYWQSFRYFSHVADQLIAELTPAGSLSDASSAIAHQIDSNLSVALHVRRGDYVSLVAAAELHGTLPLAYYVEAMARVSETVGRARYFVFSDDVEWCRANLRLADDAVFVTHNTGTDAWQDLILMARCQHQIIANSSFSWWGAWLADQRRPAPDHLVVAPARWFAGQPGQGLSDRFPAHWVVLP